MSQPAGLTIIQDAIPWEMESRLIQQIDETKWDSLLKRRVQQFGYRYDYRSKSIQAEPIQPLPLWSVNLCKLFQEKKWITDLPNQLIINEYREGQGISKHTDHPRFKGMIFSVSLGAPCKMIFRKGEQAEEFIIKSRTFLKMEGDARSLWTHEIPPLTGKEVRRISLTFRYV